MWTLSAMFWVWAWGLAALIDWSLISAWTLTWSRHRHFRRMMPMFWVAMALLGDPGGGPVFFRSGLIVVWMVLLVMGGLFESRLR
jgi:hypothetical protein